MNAHVVPRNALRDFIGKRRVSNEWFQVTQERIDLFADATLDHQYIHVDPVRAAETPFGGTIVHGFLTLSLLPRLLKPIQIIPENVVMGINYGLNRLRFPSPVPVDSEIRAAATLLEVSEPAPDRVLLTTEIVVDVRGHDRPALAAESLGMFVVAPQAMR
jgi:acyl dehydratase